MADSKISALPASTTPLAGTEVLPIVQSGATKKVSVADLTAGRAVSVSTLGITQYASGDTATMGTTSFSGGFAVTRFTHYVNCIDSDYVSAYNIGSGNNDGMMKLYGNAGRNGTPGTVRLAIGLDAPGGAAITAAIGTVSNHPLSFGVNSAEKWRITTAGDLAVKNSGNGIDFSATPGTGTSELLADYEEGTWTPSWSSGVTSYTGRSGTYTKVGRQVTVWGTIQVNVASGAGGNLTITGLPFNVAFAGGGGLTYCFPFFNTVNTDYVVMVPNSSYLDVFTLSASSIGNLAGTQIQNGTYIQFWATYQV
jgi:hypothetical protein